MNSILTVDLGFGDSGKGTIVDALARKRKADLVVRYNGGAQAGHNVVTDDGRHHTFSQFGSATFVPEVKTLLFRFVLVNPLVMQQEELHLQKKGITDAYDRTYVDNRAIVTTPYHRAANRLFEISRDKKRHGSCGQGIGETVSDTLDNPDLALTVGDLLEKPVMWQKLRAIRQRMIRRTLGLNLLEHDELTRKERSTFDEALMVKIVRRYEEWVQKVHIISEVSVRKLLHKSETSIFEGAQGVLIDETYGFHPYTTWSNTTLRNAITLLQENSCTGKTETLGIVRAYMVRHGPGPFPTECVALTQLLKDRYNPDNVWQREMRSGWLDLPLLRYARDVNGPIDGLAITHTDSLDKVSEWLVCTQYKFQDGKEYTLTKLKNPTIAAQEKLGKILVNLTYEVESVPSNLILSRIENALQASVKIASGGPCAKDKLFL